MFLSHCFRTLVEHGANIEALDSDDVTPLHRVIRSRQLENIKEFLKLGASLDKATKRLRIDHLSNGANVWSEWSECMQKRRVFLPNISICIFRCVHASL